ncbi:putative Metallo-dependent phosphatase [Vibrio nigripulchritudo SO65]|uniref:phosphodiesterase n=1 Tax=Vibrio nigripulchritudo TaxID=28173 RepID=UPI0003B23529|nr:phosphodiesterase [Vibrio nigripulchritudo]CCN37015.1 putative Metallo-dependent phosphatase [Vibrio nigripulchritudo AM115]CCN41765.1 putative Metallo-dependent phosphatase [Vibrio nigripulchritudo FTn2]CCN66442.1 putative Metallo-dependent phosphatase [Vibrio nigripulchritudo POn4]CCN74536.1 putative Metallo-dependent phosphatase [Vibrio nigripulchritudo SO65]
MLIAQLTDLHIKQDGKIAYQKVDTLQCFKDAIEHINALNVDLVVLTGDLGDFGKEEEYVIIRQELKKLNAPIRIIPGNHDHKVKLREGLSDLVDYEHPLECNFALETEHHHLIGLDSSVVGKPFGSIAKDSLNWLREKLLDTSKPTLLFMHHPPIKVGVEHMDVQNLHNSEDLWDVIAPFNQVKAVVTGHLHRPVCGIWKHLPVWVGPSHSHSVALDFDKEGIPSFQLEPKAIRLFKLDEQGIVGHISYIGQHEGPFPFFDGSALLD